MKGNEEGNELKLPRRRVLVDRANEAASVIDRLLAAGLTADEIADAVQVSKRTIYRWQKEGRAPHPLMLDGLRKLSLRKGISDE